MALVFLTLIILMLMLMLLDRVFRAEPEAAAPKSVELSAALGAPVALRQAPALAADDGDEAAAVGLAIAAALASRKVPHLAVASATRGAALAPAVVFPWDKPREAGGEQPVGEVVTVINIDGGSPVWRSQGRLKAAERR